MTKQTQIAQITETVAFADLFIHAFNPRTLVSDDETTSLAENIKIAGLIHNLAGYREDGVEGVGIVGGGRRLRALALLQDDPRFQSIPVLVTTDPDVAQLWATSENAQRKDLHPADEIRDFGLMNSRKIKAADIAVAYGVTEKHVYRRLALANLPECILTALKLEQINLSQAAAFTISNDADLCLEVLQEHLFKVAKGWAGLTDHQIKKALKPNAVKGTDRRAVFVTEETYTNAGGRITGDLFADEKQFDDAAKLDELFAEKLDFEARTFAAKNGWQWGVYVTDSYLSYDFHNEGDYGRIYEIEGELTEEEAARYDELEGMEDTGDEALQAEFEALAAKMEGDFSAEQKALAGCVMWIDRDGKVCTAGGLIRSDDKAAAIEAGILEASRHAPKEVVEKSPISEVLRADLNRIATGARQNAMIDDPKLALHLLAFQLSGQMGYSRTFGLRTDRVVNVPTSETGFALDKRLSAPEAETFDGYGREYDHPKAFASFRKQGDAKIMDFLNRKLVSLLSVDDVDLGAVIDGFIKKTTRDSFTPTAENFFGRVGGPYLNFLWSDLLGLAEDHPTITTFQKLKKAEKADKLEELFADAAVRSALGLTQEQEDRIAAWLPEGMI